MIRGLEDFWERCTRRRPSEGLSFADRVRLDALGLGLEQTLSAIHQFDSAQAFESWVLATIGEPDPDLIARFHAMLDGAPPPPNIQALVDAIDTAPDVLSAEDLAHWDEHGFVILRGAVTREQAAEAAELLWQASNARPDDPGTWYGPRTNGIMVQLFQHPALEHARRSPRVHKAFSQIWGSSDLWMTIDRMGFNAPVRAGKGFYAPRLHWDVSLVRPIPFETQGILYLTDTAADQGALELVPGFHRRIDSWLDAIGDANPREVDLSGEAICVPAGAGDLVIWHSALPHGASPNRSDRPRLVQYLTMYPPKCERQAEWR